MIFTKADLKTGMVVELADGERMIVINDSIVGINGWMPLYKYDENLKESTYHDLDINKVWEQRSFVSFIQMFHTDWLDEDRFGHKLYDRNDPVVEEMTLEQVCEELGRTIKIIPNK